VTSSIPATAAIGPPPTIPVGWSVLILTLILTPCLAGCALWPATGSWPGSSVANLWGPREDKISASRQLSRSGSQWAARGDMDQAIMAFQQAIQVWPSDVRNYQELAALYQRLGDDEAAIRWIEQGLRYDKDNVELRLKLAESWLAQGLPERAMEQIDQVLQSHQDAGAAWHLRARALYALQRDNEALADGYRALALIQDDEALLELLCRIYFRQGRPSRSWSIVQRLRARYPDDQRPASLTLLEAEALYQMNRKQDAVVALQRWYHEGGKRDPQCCALLARYQQEIDQHLPTSNPSLQNAVAASSYAGQIARTSWDSPPEHPGWGLSETGPPTPLANLYPLTERPKFRPLARQLMEWNDSTNWDEASVQSVPTASSGHPALPLSR